MSNRKTIYTIRAGHHMAEGLNFGIHLSGATMRKTVTFHSNCAYDMGSVGPQSSINKLYGFSVGLLNSNHYNSARIGWRWNRSKERIELLAYVYNNGKRVNEWDYNIALCEIKLGEPVETFIEVTESFYHFYALRREIWIREDEKRATVTDESFNVFVPRAGNGPGYCQYPYFGGDVPAPHDMTIELK